MAHRVPSGSVRTVSTGVVERDATGLEASGQRTGNSLGDRQRAKFGDKVRVQYYGTTRDSPVRVDLHGNAAEEIWYPTWKRAVKYMLTAAITVVSLAFVASSLAVLILFRVWFRSFEQRDGMNLDTLGVALGRCISAPAVLLANWLNKWITLKLVRPAPELSAYCREGFDEGSI